MARGRCTFKQRDVTRALKAAIAAGVAARVEIDQDGKIVVVMPAPPTQSEPEPKSGAAPGEIIL